MSRLLTSLPLVKQGNQTTRGPRFKQQKSFKLNLISADFVLVCVFTTRLQKPPSIIHLKTWSIRGHGPGRPPGFFDLVVIKNNKAWFSMIQAQHLQQNSTVSWTPNHVVNLDMDWTRGPPDRNGLCIVYISYRKVSSSIHVLQLGASWLKTGEEPSKPLILNPIVKRKCTKMASSNVRHEKPSY